jgi:hypothetical protein
MTYASGSEYRGYWVSNERGSRAEAEATAGDGTAQNN